MKFWIILLLVFFIHDVLNAQSYLQTGLSKTFNFKTTRISHKTDSGYHNEIELIILKKSTRTIVQEIKFQAGYLFEDAFKNPNEVRSYITGKNKNKDVPDYDAGDLIIADLNFDGKEDVAIKNDSGGNGGPFYNYYIQDNKGQFKLDNYLTKHVNPFPEYINPKIKTLVTITHANVMQQREITYQYAWRNKQWHLKKHILVN